MGRLAGWYAQTPGSAISYRGDLAPSASRQYCAVHDLSLPREPTCIDDTSGDVLCSSLMHLHILVGAPSSTSIHHVSTCELWRVAYLTTVNRELLDLSASHRGEKGAEI